MGVCRMDTVGMASAKSIRVSVDAKGRLTADLGAFPPPLRRRVVSAVQGALRALSEREHDEPTLTRAEWDAAWEPVIRQRLRDVARGRAKTIAAAVALERVRRAARGRR